MNFGTSRASAVEKLNKFTEENLFEYRVVKDGDAELDRYFYYDYVVFGSYCAGLIGSIENIPNTLPLN